MLTLPFRVGAVEYSVGGYSSLSGLCGTVTGKSACHLALRKTEVADFLLASSIFPRKQEGVAMTVRRHARGVTVIELVIAISVIAIMAAVGIPAFTGMIEARRLTGAVERLANDLRTVRTKAITTGNSHLLAYAAGQYRLEQWNAATNAWVPITIWYSLST